MYGTQRAWPRRRRTARRRTEHAGLLGNFPPIELEKARVVKRGAELRLRAVEKAQDGGVGLELRREERAELREGLCEVERVGVRGFVIDNPPDVTAGNERFGPGSEETINADGAEGAAEQAGPGSLRGCVGMRRENPLGNGVGGGARNQFDGTGGGGLCLSGREPGGACLGDEGRQKCGKRLERGRHFKGAAQARELLKEHVDGEADGARGEAAFMAVEERRAGVDGA